MVRSVALPGMPPEALRLMRAGAGGANPEDAARAEWQADAGRFVAGFADGVGNRRRVDRPLLAWVLGANAIGMDAGGMDATGTRATRGDLDPEERAWWSLHEPRVGTDAGAWAGVAFDGDGPLFPGLRERGIEWWTQAELCGVHALSHVAIARDAEPTVHRAVLRRLAAACEWLIDEVQPDNATQLPWAVHCFAALSLVPGRDAGRAAAARQYAQTLIHNAIVDGGVPDRFAACVLWDSAEWLARGARVATGTWEAYQRV